ncbi:M15 family metallopeptidase [Arthrobacter sp. M4]|nr:M15 family metallopeptidase [Arthrobacter sp. M4]
MASCGSPTPTAPVTSATGSPSASASETTTAAAAASASEAPSSAAQAAPMDPQLQAAAAGGPAAGAPFRTLPVQHSLDDPASPWVVVNKRRPITPAQFVPGDLVRPAVPLAVSGEAALLNRTTAAAAERLFAAASAAGAPMALASGYRSYATQTATYNSYAATRGTESADTASARPGYSEHQTGWAFDIADAGGACSFEPCFADQPAAVWVREHAHEFGFVVRYPWMLHETTGYFYEPWHLRYVGVEAATDMRARGIATLEEYFGTGVAPGYL